VIAWLNVGEDGIIAVLERLARINSRAVTVVQQQYDRQLAWTADRWTN